MTKTVIVSADGRTATVSGRQHTTKINGLEDAARWVRFYRKLAAGKSGAHYQSPLVAFQDALARMEKMQVARDVCGVSTVGVVDA